MSEPLRPIAAQDWQRLLQLCTALTTECEKIEKGGDRDEALQAIVAKSSKEIASICNTLSIHPDMKLEALVVNTENGGLRNPFAPEVVTAEVSLNHYFGHAIGGYHKFEWFMQGRDTQADTVMRIAYAMANLARHKLKPTAPNPFPC